METDVQQRIRDRAYAIWVEEGCPHGRDTDHWLQAERDIAVSLTDTAPAALATAMDAEPAASKPKRARSGTATPKAVADAKAPAKKTAGRKKADGDGTAAEKAETGAPKTARTRRKSSAAPV